MKKKVGKTVRRRRLEAKTNYSKRIKLLKGNSPRIVFRKSNKYILAQFVESKEAQDKIKFGITSKKLLDYGWPKEAVNSLKTLPASYLTGFLMGNKVSDKEKVIVDFGMNRNVHKSKVYAFIKGLVDAGIDVTEKENIFPDKERLEGKHLKTDVISKKFDEIKNKIGGKK